MTVFIAGLMIKLAYFDLTGWKLTTDLLYGGDYSFLAAGMRMMDFGVIIGLLGFAVYLLVGDTSARNVRVLLSGLSVALAFVWLTLELNTFLTHFVPGLRAGGISILWSVFALALIFYGIKRKTGALRYLGLGLFAIVVWKVFWRDLAELDPVYKIVAFIFLGLLVLCGSFIYLKYQQNFLTGSSTTQETEE